MEKQYLVSNGNPRGYSTLENENSIEYENPTQEFEKQRMCLVLCICHVIYILIDY